MRASGVHNALSIAAIHKDASYRSFTKFVIDGYYVGRSGETTGSSFATPRAAAYASIMVAADPTVQSKRVEAEFERMGVHYMTLPEGVKRIGTDDMVAGLKTLRVELAKGPDNGAASMRMAMVDRPSTR